MDRIKAQKIFYYWADDMPKKDNTRRVKGTYYFIAIATTPFFVNIRCAGKTKKNKTGKIGGLEHLAKELRWAKLAGFRRIVSGIPLGYEEIFEQDNMKPNMVTHRELDELEMIALEMLLKKKTKKKK